MNDLLNIMQEQQKRIDELEKRISSTRDAEKAMHLAICKAQGAIEDIVKDTENPFYNSRYASPAAILKAIKKPLLDNNLYITHKVICNDDIRVVEVKKNRYDKSETTKIEMVKLEVISTLQHSEGASISCKMWAECENNIQQRGSIITYCKRYNIMSLLNLSADDDDDGNCTMQSLKCCICGSDIPASIKANGKTINYPEYSKSNLGNYFCLDCGKNKKAGIKKQNTTFPISSEPEISGKEGKTDSDKSPKTV